MTDPSDDPYLGPTPSSYLDQAEQIEKQKNQMPPELRELIDRITKSGVADVTVIGPQESPDLFSNEIVRDHFAGMLGRMQQVLPTAPSFDPNVKEAVSFLHDYLHARKEIVEAADSVTEAELALSSLGIELDTARTIVHDAGHLVVDLMESIFDETAYQRIVAETTLCEEMMLRIIGAFTVGVLTERNRQSHGHHSTTEGADPGTAESS